MLDLRHATALRFSSQKQMCTGLNNSQVVNILASLEAINQCGTHFLLNTSFLCASPPPVRNETRFA
ncbi:hypothetical protein VCRA2116O29_140080 [Vibrio crassostreae]|nr:hypothetical protein VCRA2116O29_140080 [Vibrio crassostreae]CAK2414862.1 hypothetical protein VCRA2119O48_160026 [Vibrio crassostreae]CAK3608470.1 hypothetical protein VCRA2123O74_140080 [Vibrio crassostreae]CAK3795231.1 hypothetical protein VCRA212O16_160082 [Vibrio crassostreae]